MFVAPSISFFAAGWLLLCSTHPLYSSVGRSSHEINSPLRQHFRPLQSEAVLFEERSEYNNPKVPYDVTYRYNYQHRSENPRISSKDIYAKKNAEKPLTKNPHLDERYEEAQRKDEEITKKIIVLEKILFEDINENDVELGNTIGERNITEPIPEETKRVVRQVRRQRPGFFWTLARLAFETFNDTRSAIQQISNVINQNFEPDTSTRPQTVSSNSLMIADVKTTTPSNDQNNTSSNLAVVNVTTTMTTTTTTTEAPFRLTRNSLQNIIGRNLRGLVRLFNIEWQDALNQSEINVREFRKDLGNQVGGFLQDDPNAF